MQNQHQLSNLTGMQQRGGLNMNGLIQQHLGQQQNMYGDNRDIIAALARQQGMNNNGNNFSQPIQQHQHQQAMNYRQQHNNMGFSNHGQVRNLPGHHSSLSLQQALQHRQQQQRQPQKSPFALLQEEHEVRDVLTKYQLIM
jgi:hypothetical protein